MNIVMIGSGNVATNLAVALASKCRIVQVYSHTLANAQSLALRVGADATASLDQLRQDADIYIVSVKDDVIQSVIESTPDNGALWVHTSGTKPIDLFAAHRAHYGVFYPMQSFSKSLLADFSKVHFFVEASSEADTEKVESLALMLTPFVKRTDSATRGRLHIAAVFACNFTNQMWTFANEVLADADLPFDAMMPLISTTVEKLQSLTPMQSQTGPAVRHDTEVMNKHMAMLDDEKREIYRLISDSIMKRH